MFVPTKRLLNDILNFISVTQAGAGECIIFPAKVGLIKSDFAFSPDSVQADVDLVEADYNTYARVVAAPYTVAFLAEGGLVIIRAALMHVQMTDNLAPNTIYGAFLSDTTGAILLGGERFSTPIPLVTTLDAFDYRLTFGFDPTANFGLGLLG